MRSFVVAGICLLLASSAMAATQVSLLSGGSAVVVDPVATPNIQLDIMIATDEPGLTAGSFGFDAPAGVLYAQMEFVSVGPPTPGTYVPNYGDGPGSLVNSAGWSTVYDVDATWLAGGDINDIVADVPGVEMSTLFNDADNLPTDGLFGWLEITLVPAEQGPYTIDISGTVGDAVGNPLADVTFRPLTVLPEPASALLLLLGVPFLRRRR